MSKVKELASEAFERKDYIKGKNIHQPRQMFKQRSKKIEVKMNIKNNPKYSQELWRCDSCLSGAVETQSHVL